jgi:tetratricopeptide (TPR) repeat protein
LALLEGDLLLERFGMYAPPSAFSRIWLALCFSELGQFGRGIARGDEAVRVIEKVESPYALAVACWGLGHLYLRKGEFDQAGVQLERALALSRECDLVGIYPLCRSFLGSAYALSGRLTEAIPLLEDGVDLLVPMRQRLYFSLVLTRLGEGYLLAGRKDDAFQVAGRALDVARQQKERGHQAWALRLLGEIAAQRDPLDAQEAEVYYRQATALAQELGMRPLVAHCHLGLGKLYRRTGKRQEAQEHLTTATTMCREMDMGLWLEQAEAKTKELS